MQHVLAAFFMFKLPKVCLLGWVFVSGCSLEQHGRWQNSCSERLGGRAESGVQLGAVHSQTICLKQLEALALRGHAREAVGTVGGGSGCWGEALGSPRLPPVGSFPHVAPCPPVPTGAVSPFQPSGHLASITLGRGSLEPEATHTKR